MLGFDLAEHVARIEAQGFTVIPDLLTAADLAEVQRVLALYLGTHTGRNDFEGTRTERVYTLVSLSTIVTVDAFTAENGGTEVNFTLGVPPAVAREMPPRLQELLGYSIHPPFTQARAAGARLPE
jgi:hypothetical protein